MTGMRVGEAIGLDRSNVSWEQGQLTVEREQCLKPVDEREGRTFPVIE